MGQLQFELSRLWWFSFLSHHHTIIGSKLRRLSCAATRPFLYFVSLNYSRTNHLYLVITVQEIYIVYIYFAYLPALSLLYIFMWVWLWYGITLYSTFFCIEVDKAHRRQNRRHFTPQSLTLSRHQFAHHFYLVPKGHFVSCSKWLYQTCGPI